VLLCEDSSRCSPHRFTSASSQVSLACANASYNDHEVNEGESLVGVTFDHLKCEKMNVGRSEKLKRGTYRCTIPWGQFDTVYICG
jgi:hypothetical protein